MQDQKSSHEQKAKETLQKVLEEKMCCRTATAEQTGVGMLHNPWGWEPWGSLGGKGASCTTPWNPQGTTLSSDLPQRSLALAEHKCEEWKSQYESHPQHATVPYPASPVIMNAVFLLFFTMWYIWIFFE